jgi:hypothetical protein
MSRVLVHCILFLLAACARPSEAQFPQSACTDRMFEGSRFELCSQRGGEIEIGTAGASGTA